MIKLAEDETPVAYSNYKAAKNCIKAGSESFLILQLLWSAFNNIYTIIGYYHGIKPGIGLEKDGSIKVRQNGSVLIPVPIAPREHELLDSVFSEFTINLKDELITHENTKFFVYRKPKWHGIEIDHDGRNQLVNGVINVSLTLDENNVIWSPIDVSSYKDYMRGQRDDTTRDFLAKQIVYMIYTIRNNTHHGSKRHDDANDTEVINKAIPLLEKIVISFLDL